MSGIVANEERPTASALCHGVLNNPQVLLLLVLLVLLAICVQVARGFEHATIVRYRALEGETTA